MKTIKLAFRSILHFRMYSGVNIVGLSLSLACVIIIFRYVYGELTVDRFNKKYDRIYVTAQETSDNPGNLTFSGIFNPNKEKTFVDITEHPGVERYTEFTLFEKDEIDVANQKYNATVLAADSNFLKVIDYPVISGIERLSEPNSALITKSFAQKIFGDQNPVGKTFRHSTGEILTITGIIGQVSTKTTFSFDIIVSYYLSDSWSKTPQTFVLLYQNTDYKVINKKYESFFDMPHWQHQTRYQLFPLSKVYFNKSITNYDYRQGNYNYVTVMMIVGALILLVGIINYINIYTVIILRRGRELGTKKVFGASGYDIFMQLLVENLMMTALSIMFAFLIIRLTYPLISNVLQFDMIPNIHFDLFLSLTLLLSLPLITTLYPFFRYNYSKVINSLRNLDKISSTGSLRRIFLSFQYIITIVMIVVSLFFVKQLRFMLNADLGYRTKDIVKVQFLKMQSNWNIRNPEEATKRWENEKRIADEITQKMNACTLFSYWTNGESPNELSTGKFAFKLPDGEYKEVVLAGADENWFKLFDIALKEGRLWDDKKDSFFGYAAIVTESVLKLYGITDFNSAQLQPGRRLWWSSDRMEEMKTNPPYRIVGVVKDFNNSHLSQQSDPIVFYYNTRQRTDPLMAAIVPGQTKEAIEFLRRLHEEMVGGEFTYSFVEDEVHEIYKEDKKVAGIYSIFTFIAIFISALGLFSMSLFDIQQRRKEIAIRKINGARTKDLIRLLLKKYFILLGIAFVLSIPIALFAIHKYLENFAHKTSVSWWLFGIAIVAAAGISLLTLIFQTCKASWKNPAEVVKKE